VTRPHEGIEHRRTDVPAGASQEDPHRTPPL
jgi:hypothetical protein